MPTLRLALAQVNPCVGDIAGNSALVRRVCAEAALAGAHVATIPPKIFDQMLGHPLTDKGIEAFMADWKKSGR